MVVGAYATVRFPRELYQTDPLIIADGLNVNTDGPGKLAYAHLCGLEDAIDEKRRASIESWRFQIQDTRHSLVGTRESEDLRILIKVAEKGKSSLKWEPKEHRDHIMGNHVQGYIDLLKKDKGTKYNK